jgi:cobalt/nickel transport system permease protein
VGGRSRVGPTVAYTVTYFHVTAEHGHDHGTFVESLDPRVKLVSALVVALWIGLLPVGREALLGCLLATLVAIAALARIPPSGLVIRASGALPFVLVPALLGLVAGTFDGHALFGMAARGYLAAMVATLLASVTPFASLLAAASSLGVPDILVQTTALVYRYLLVLRDRGAALATSARARGYGARTPQRFAVAGTLLGSLLLRSLDRAERVHRSMLARGYAGHFPAPRLRAMRGRDWLAGGLVLGLTAGSLVWVH